MKGKLVYESLNEYMNIEESSVSAEMSPEEFNEKMEELIALNNKEVAYKKLKEFFDEHPYMHEELGEVEGRDKYAKGINMFLKYYSPDDWRPDKIKPVPTPKPKVKKQKADRSRWIDPEEAKRILIGIVDTATSENQITDEITKFFDEHPYMHEELGEIEGRDYYKNAIDAFLAAYDEKFPE